MARSLRTDQRLSQGASIQTAPPLPLALDLSARARPTCTGPDVAVPATGMVTILPGDYGTLTVGDQGGVTFVPGVYNLGVPRPLRHRYRPVRLASLATLARRALLLSHEGRSTARPRRDAGSLAFLASCARPSPSSPGRAAETDGRAALPPFPCLVPRTRRPRWRAVVPGLRVPPPDLTTFAEDHGGRFPRTNVIEMITGQREILAHGTVNRRAGRRRSLGLTGPFCRAYQDGLNVGPDATRWNA